MEYKFENDFEYKVKDKTIIIFDEYKIIKINTDDFISLETDLEYNRVIRLSCKYTFKELALRFVNPNDDILLLYEDLKDELLKLFKSQ